MFEWSYLIYKKMNICLTQLLGAILPIISLPLSTVFTWDMPRNMESGDVIPIPVRDSINYYECMLDRFASQRSRY